MMGTIGYPSGEITESARAKLVGAAGRVRRNGVRPGNAKTAELAALRTAGARGLAAASSALLPRLPAAGLLACWPADLSPTTVSVAQVSSAVLQHLSVVVLNIWLSRMAIG